MPKQMTDKEKILEAALEMTREQGHASVHARSIAAYMKQSVQPIYSYFENMEALKEALYMKAMAYYRDFILSRTDSQNVLKSMGIANIEFAEKEGNLFRMLFFSKLQGYNSFSDIYDKMGDKEAAENVAQKLGIGEESAKELYIMMIIFTHGIASMLATNSADIPKEEIIVLMEKAYQAFAKYQTNNQ